MHPFRGGPKRNRICLPLLGKPAVLSLRSLQTHRRIVTPFTVIPSQSGPDWGMETTT